jgi:hypothetical protein
MKEDHANTAEEYKIHLAEEGIHDCRFIYFDTGQDIETYKGVAAQVDTDYLLILNMFSQVLAPDWLKHYVDKMNDTVGVISSTASNQSYYSSVYQKHPWYWETTKGFNYNFRKYKLFFKAFFYWRFLFKPFPNPHLRTSAFFIRPKELLAMNFKFVKNKFTAYQFENGRNSMTVCYRKKGLKTLVMDKHGKVYEPSEWIHPHSGSITRKIFSYLITRQPFTRKQMSRNENL